MLLKPVCLLEGSACWKGLSAGRVFEESMFLLFCRPVLVSVHMYDVASRILTSIVEKDMSYETFLIG